MNLGMRIKNHVRKWVVGSTGWVRQKWSSWRGVTRTMVVVSIIALVINIGVLFVMPLIKHIRKEQLLEADVNANAQLKVTRVSFEEKEKPVKKVKIKTVKPKLTKKEVRDDRFDLDFAVGANGGGAAISSDDVGSVIYDEGDVEVDPVRISGREPEVPFAFAATEGEGRVEVQVVIDTDGRVGEVQVILEDPPSYQLGRAVAAAVRTWKYRPAMVKGIPVRIRVIVPFIFS
ncbi:hypothetical protein COTS27_01239 [Spirochaetota bacterium]|nr:hypothetical protein COTS27_01239 [Spirochaetota bacterium]